MKQILLLKDALRPLLDAIRDLTPIVLVIAFFQVVVFQQSLFALEHMVSGLFLVMIGLALFVRGLEIGLFPLGEGLAQAFARKGSSFWLFLFAFLLGFGTTIAEPALIAVASKAAEVAAEGHLIDHTQRAMDDYALGLRLTVALSVGVAILLGVLRIIFAWPLHYCIISGYILVIAMTSFTPESMIGIAYDSGGVTTSTITVPLITALGVGLASSLRGRNPILDGFGMIAFASLLPVLFVMLYGIVVFA
ncbi:MAG: DUF1538 domain-containing protein [Zetaproteobacteria bacterium]|nr:DUF1538 domain-containing protein [Zetaproteobacteria bacterium]